MKLGAVTFYNQKGQPLVFGGIEVSNIKEIVINHVIHTKNSDGTWTQNGSKRKITIPHELMVRKVKNLTRNTDRFSTWISGYTINICLKTMDKHKESPVSNTNFSTMNKY